MVRFGSKIKRRLQSIIHFHEDGLQRKRLYGYESHRIDQTHLTTNAFETHGHETGVRELNRQPANLREGRRNFYFDKNHTRVICKQAEIQGEAQTS